MYTGEPEYGTGSNGELEISDKIVSIARNISDTSVSYVSILHTAQHTLFTVRKFFMTQYMQCM